MTRLLKPSECAKVSRDKTQNWTYDILGDDDEVHVHPNIKKLQTYMIKHL